MSLSMKGYKMGIENRITRRDFIKYAGALGISLGLGLNPYSSEAKMINGVYVDDTTKWTPEKFEEYIKNNKKGIIYWRMESVGNNQLGDMMMKYFCNDFSKNNIEFYQIELSKNYSKDSIIRFKNILEHLLPDFQFRVPCWSIINNGEELRILGPSGKNLSDLKRIYEHKIKPSIDKYLN